MTVSKRNNSELHVLSVFWFEKREKGVGEWVGNLERGPLLFWTGFWTWNLVKWGCRISEPVSPWVSVHCPTGWLCFPSPFSGQSQFVLHTAHCTVTGQHSVLFSPLRAFMTILNWTRIRLVTRTSASQVTIEPSSTYINLFNLNRTETHKSIKKEVYEFHVKWLWQQPWCFQKHR